MSVRVVIGAQWGDEGKGKIVDILSHKADYVVRYQGGANAGHTLHFEGETHVLHLIPSGIFHPGTHCVIGNGVVVDPVTLLEEMDRVRQTGAELENRLFISETAHVILPYHKQLDQVGEHALGQQKIGTTGRGIGPAYVHKVARVGIRMGDLLDEKVLRKKMEINLTEINTRLAAYHAEPLDLTGMMEEMTRAAESLRPFICQTTSLLHKALADRKKIVLEGAQGALLDIDHGTYPFVTSSSPTAGGACTGSGIPPTALQHIMGISKAYCTRVGNGPFPTELDNEQGEQLRNAGHEFGSTTGRPRRCGWIDLVALDYAVKINGINELVITKLDVLDSFETVKACTSYRINGKSTNVFPVSLNRLEQAEPVYESFPGWKTETRDIRSYEELPGPTRRFLEFISSHLGVAVKIVSTGPGRDETMVLSDLYPE